MRVCHGGWLNTEMFMIEGHSLVVVAKDGHRTVPIEATGVVLHAGERVDVLVTARADAKVGDTFTVSNCIRYTATNRHVENVTLRGVENVIQRDSLDTVCVCLVSRERDGSCENDRRFHRRFAT